MQASDLLQMLESSEINVLDNQAISDEMAGGIDSVSLLGAMETDFINTDFAQSMPEPNEEVLNASLDDQILNLDTSNDAPGLG